MAKTATVTISWQIIGDELVGTVPNSVQFTNANSPGEMALVPLSIGRTQLFFPGPPTFVGVLIIPPSSSTVAKTWDASGTVGGPLHPSQPSFISVPSGTTSVNISANGSEVIKVYFL